MPEPAARTSPTDTAPAEAASGPKPALTLVPPPPAEPSPAPRNAEGRIALSIGAKFLALMLAMLVMAVTVVVFNATRLFQKDNLNNIYVASDLLTAAKAGEVRSWMDGLIGKGSVIAKILLARPAPSGAAAPRAATRGAAAGALAAGAASSPTDTAALPASTSTPASAPAPEPLLRTFEAEPEILSVTLYRKAPGAAQTAAFAPGSSWSNTKLLQAMNLSPERLDDLRGDASIPFDHVSSGLIDVSSRILPDGQPLMAITVPLVQESPGVFSVLVSMIVKQEKLMESFADSGAYTLALVDKAGRVLAHPDAARVREHENMMSVPIVRRMIESDLQREFQEYSAGGTQFLGAYAKVGIAGIGVVSQVPRARAFEAGQTLVRRSLLITGLVLSVAFVLAYLFAQTLVSPIRKLSAAAEEVSKGNFNIRVHVNTRDEISRLAASFNSMSGEIERKIKNLSRINESSKVISSTLEAAKLMEFSLDTLLSLLHARKGVVWLWDARKRAAGELAFGLAVRRGWSEAELQSSADLFAQIVATRQPAILSLGGPGVLVVPILEKGEAVGCAVLAEREDGKAFAEEDIFMAGTIMTSVGITFQNIDLLRKTADNARMEKELETAKLVQDTMFPPAEIKLPGLELQSYYVPAGECGGDWWGMLNLPGGKVLLAVGDATGHGVPAAMVTATAKAACSVIHLIAERVPEIASDPATVLRFLNKAVYESTLGKILMTFFVAVMDTRTGEVTYATASHDPIYWYKTPKDATPENSSKDNIDVLLSDAGPRLGQGAQAEYRNATAKLGDGDFILLYTDGLPEGKNPGGSEEYGDRKFLRSIGKHAHKPAAEIREGILADFRKFIVDEPLHDDVTLVVCRYTPPA